MIRKNKKMINSKQKGKRFELELVHELKARGYDVRRTAQYCGKTKESSDLVGIPNIHIECKAREKHNIYDYIEQVDRDKQDDELGCVFIKSNKKKWLVLMDLDDWETLHRSELYKEHSCASCKNANWEYDEKVGEHIGSCEIKERFKNKSTCCYDSRLEK